jgi:uncharacterized membrane protein/Tfp pilus assembly protein PilF
VSDRDPAAARPKGRWPRPKPEWVFLALALPFGAAFLVLTPPFQVPDEEAHFRRAFEFSESRLIAVKQGDRTGDFLPAGLDGLWESFSRLCAHPEEKTDARQILDSAALTFSAGDREFVPFANTAMRPPVTYLPQTLAILAARQFCSSVFVCLYAARTLNLLTAIVLTFLAVRITPVAKWGFAALALTPMALYEAASASSDAATNSLAFLFVAYVLACAVTEKVVLPTRSVVAVALLSTAVGLAKLVYFPLALSYALIPVSKLGSRRRYWLGFAAVVLATAAPIFAWSSLVRGVYSKPDLRFGMDAPEQLRRMMSLHPEFGRQLLATAGRARIYGEEYLGFLGWLDTRMPNWFYFAELALLLIACLSDPGARSRMTGRQALLAAGIALLVCGTVLLIVHVMWDRVGTPYIVAQGRYFIPAGPLVAVALGWLGARYLRGASAFAARFLPALVAAAVPVLLATSVVRLYDRFYVDSDLARAERAYQRGQALLKEPDHREQAYRQFEEAIRIDPDHPGAHYMLGVLDQVKSPRAAAEHLRAALRREPGHVPTLTHLAGTLADQLEYAEAIRSYEEALRLRPDDVKIQMALAQLREAQKGMTDAMTHMGSVLRSLAQANAEERHAGTADAGLYLKPLRSRVVAADGRPPRMPVEFFWRSPSPGGQEIRLAGPGGDAGAGRRMPFYACASQPIGPKRVFVFPPPVNARLLADEDVSWFFQVPLGELDDRERGAEMRYRQERGLRFPLRALPD